MDESRVPGRQRERDAGRHEFPLARAQVHVDRGDQVGTSITVMRVRGQIDLGVETLDRYFHSFGSSWLRTEPTLPPGPNGAAWQPEVMTDSPRGSGEYAEVLRVPLSWWLMTAGFAIIVWWIFVLVTPMPFAIGVGVIAFGAVGVVLWQYGSAQITVNDAFVTASGARIEIEQCGDAVAQDAGRTAAVRGPDADARAYLALRPYIATSVRLTITDEHDPTPYWLISTRNPQRLADAITTARHRATATDD